MSEVPEKSPATFDRLFTKEWWGWHLRGWPPKESPITLWMVAGGRYQVNLNRWPKHTMFGLPQAQDAALALWRMHVEVAD